MKKNKIIVIVRRGPLEIEWIMPILKILYERKFEIYFYFNNENCFNLVFTDNKIYNEREEILTNLNKKSVIYNNIKNNKKLTNKLNIIKDKKYEKINNLSDIQLQIIELSKTI